MDAIWMNAARTGPDQPGDTTTDGSRMSSILPLGRLWRPITVLVALFLAVAAAQASERVGFGEKVYDPVSGRYFEMVKATPADHIYGHPRIWWGTAQKNAAQMVHNGVRGRLAVVDSRHVHEFLLRTFWAQEPVWIGLRYWCQLNRLEWVTGETVKPSDFVAWSLQWAHTGGSPQDIASRQPNCSSPSDYWPVHYWPVQHGFSWNANGRIKGFGAYFVEYPTGKP